MDLSIIIVNYNVYDYVLVCIESIRDDLKCHELKYEIFVVDNNSEERSIEKLNDIFPEVHLVQLRKNIGFGSANNIALKNASGKYLLLLNPDIIVKENCITRLVSFLENNQKVGVLAPVLLRPDGNLDYYYSFLPSMYSIIMQQFGLYNSAKGMKKRMFKFVDENINNGLPFTVEQAMGACILTRKSIYDSLGGFDEAFFLYQEETDWEYRMKKAGWKVMVLPEAIAIHDHHSAANKLGKIYVGYHGIRSIIIYFVKNFNLLKRTMLRITMLFALFFRAMKYVIIYFIKPRELFESIYYVFSLFMITLTPRKVLMSKRYDYNRKLSF